MTHLTVNPASRLLLSLVVQSGPTLTLQVAPAYDLTLATVGVQGPPGAGSADTVTAAENLGGHRVVTAAGLHATESTIDLAIGITSGAASIGTEAAYVCCGVMDEPGWNWVPGGPIFVGALGVLTQIEPVGTLRQVAAAVNATRIAVNIGPTIYRG